MLMAGKSFGSFMGRLCLLFLCVTNMCMSAAEKSLPTIHPGIYWQGTARIGYDNGRISGTIDATIGANGESVCQFYFDGKVTGKSFDIVCHNFIDTEAISGTLTVQNDSTLLIKTVENPGCSEMIADVAGKGLSLAFYEKKSLLQVRIVKAEKAFFHATPKIADKKKSYLIRGNEAQVFEINDGWLKVVSGKTTGWMWEEDMCPLH
jgi:hypothetical protein